MQNPFRVVKYVVRTEKGTRIESQNKYIFCVDNKANKIEIKHAIEYIYRVKVKTVNTALIAGKTRRVRYKAGRTPEWKKAVVTLEKGQKIKIA